MSKVEKLDLMGVTSLAVVAAALLVGWMVSTRHAESLATRVSATEPTVTLAPDGTMRMTVTELRSVEAAPAAPARRTVALRTASASPALEVALPYALRP